MLDSCPFCGGTAYLWQNYNQKAGCYFVFVKCDTCNSQGRSFRSETSPEGDDWEWPDMHNYTFEFPGGKVITWEGISCMAALPYMGMATGAMVYGDKACVLFRPNNTVEMFDLGGQLIREWKGAKPVGEAKDTSNRQNGGPGDSTLYHLRNFVDCIRANTPDKANANAEIGVKSTFLALAANIAHRTGETVRIDPATGRLAKGSAGADLWAREYEKGWEIG